MKRTIVLLTAIPVVSLLAGCGSSTTTGAPTPTVAPAISTPTATATPTAAPTPTPTASVATVVPLGGTWNGQYSGKYNGTFVLIWQQSGAGLVGTIALSSPAATLHITGNASGSSINFGAVGTVAYTGTISGNTMSGTYVEAGGAGSGSWSATKSG